MKKLFTVAILGLLSTGAFAQTSQGTKVVSGSVRFNKYSDNSTNQSFSNSDYSRIYFDIDPSFGYFLKDNLEAGISLGYYYQKTELKQDDEFSDYKSISRNNTFSFSPYFKKYFSLSEKVALSTRLAAGVSIGNGENEVTTDHSSTSEYKSNGYFANFIPGISFFPTEKIGLSGYFGNLGYSRMTLENGINGSRSTSKSFDLNLSSSTFGIGFSYHF